MTSQEITKLTEAIEDAQGNETILDGIKAEAKMTADDFHNKRTELYSLLRYQQRMGRVRMANQAAEAIEDLEKEYYQ